VALQLKKGLSPIASIGEKNSSLKAFGAGVLISVSLIAQPYLDADVDFLGEPPSLEEAKRAKLSHLDQGLLDALLELGENPSALSKQSSYGPYKIKERAWLAVREMVDLFPNKTVFDLTWRRLKRGGKIKYRSDSD
jgi:hypothetical protein